MGWVISEEAMERVDAIMDQFNEGYPLNRAAVVGVLALVRMGRVHVSEQPPLSEEFGVRKWVEIGKGGDDGGSDQG